MQISLPETISNSYEQDKVKTEESSTQRPFRFEPERKIHQKKLFEWCKEVWIPDFKKAIMAGNPPYYHDCCCAFSRRAFAKKTGHPSIQTCAVTKIPSFKDVETVEEFYKWLYKLLSGNRKRGERCLFPRFNIEHFEDDGLSELEASATIKELRTLLEESNLSIAEHELNIKNLKTENEKLLHSSKTWYLRYQELLEQPKKPEDLVYSTPLKKTNYAFDVLQDY